MSAAGIVASYWVLPAGNAEGWIGAGDHDVIVNAHGSMSGVREIELTAPTGSAPRVRTYPCLMGVVALCPTDWSQTFTIAQDDLPEGASDLQAVATDGLGTRSDPVVKTVKVDRSAPELQLGGALSDAADSWLDDRAYALAIAASDGSPSQLRSGVRSIELLVDDVRQAFAEQECPTGSCPMQRVLQVDAAELAEGRHDVRVVAIDQAGNRTQRSFSVGVDRRVPELVLTGALAGEPDGQPGVLRVAAREPDLAATGSGVVRLS